MDIGGELRRARESRQRSIDQIAQVTKINWHFLDAIEHNRFSFLPGGLFTRGFLRAYAREVGLDPEDIVARYRAEFEMAAPSGEPTCSDSPDRSAELALSFADEQDSSQTRYNQSVTVAVIVVASAMLYLMSAREVTQPPGEGPTSPAANAASSVTERPIATAGSVDVTPAPQAVLKLEMWPHGPCWVEATADGERVLGRLLNAGDREVIEAREELTLRVGDPSTFAFSINGVAGRSLGRAGEAVTIRLTRQNYMTFGESPRQKQS